MMMGAGWTRLLNIGCRTVHLVAVSAVVGGTLWGVDPERLGLSLWLAVGSGLGLVALESQARPSWLVEGRGLVAIGKLGLLALAPYAGRHQGLLLVGVVIVASGGAHLPRSLRHWSLRPLITDDSGAEDGGVPELDLGPAMAGGARWGGGIMTDSVRTALLGVALTVAVTVPGAALGQPLAPLPPLAAPKTEQVELGKRLFFDPRLSGDGGVACASCHDPATGWGDGKPLSTGYPGSEYFRNAQTLLNAAHYRRNYWDGRMAGTDLPTLVRDHLTEAHFMQVDGRLVSERMKQVPEYVELYQHAFGGEPNFGRTITAVAAFVRTLVSRNAPLDRYLQGDAGALSADARRGLDLFQGKAGCVQCHGGPLLSDQQFYALGVPESTDLFKNPHRHISFRRFFRTLGAPGVERYREDPGLYGVTKDRADWGKFRTPSLREVTRTEPYMHNGMLATLEDVVAFYNRGGGSHPSKTPRLRPLGLSGAEAQDLVEFLKSLAGDPVVLEPPDPPDYQPRALGRN